MRATACDEHLKALLRRIEYDGIDAEVYEKIAVAFANGAAGCSKPLIKQLLSFFVSYTEDEPIYVNEIKDILHKDDPDLFMAYAQRFTDCMGSKEVFGIDPVCPKSPYSMLEEEQSSEETAPKRYEKRKKRIKKRIRREARDKNVSRHKERQEMQRRKREKRAKFEALVKKLNGA